MNKLLILAILMTGVIHARNLAAIETLATEVASRTSHEETCELVQQDRRTNENRERRVGQITGEHVAWGGSTATITPTQEVDDCLCGPDCECPDRMVCKNGDCKRNYVIFFSAKWCRPCHVMYPRIDELRNAGYIVYVFDVDDFKKAAEQFQIRSLPTTIVMNEGKETHRFVGVVEKERITRVTKTRDQQATCNYNFCSWKTQPISKPGFRPHTTN